MRIGRSNSYMASYRAIRHSRSGGTYRSKLRSTSRRTATKASTASSADSAQKASVANRLNNKAYSSTSTSSIRKTASSEAVLSSRNAAAKQHYSAIVKSVASFSENIEKISGEKSQLFTNANSTDADIAAKAKSEITDAVKSIVSDYNSIYQHLGASTDSMSKNHTKQMKSMTRIQSLAFNKIGIKMSSAGTLQIDEKALESADIAKIEKLFKGTDSFAMRWSAKAQTISKNAASRVEGLEALSYSSSGSVIGNYATSGTIWDTQV